MASKIKVDQIVGSTGSTVTIPTGQTLSIVDGVPVASGGTGLASFTAGDVLYATGSTTLAKLAKGTAEQVLAMNSGATAPDWGSVDLTALPTITVAKGGTNLSSFTAGDVLYATGATTLAKLAKGTAAQQIQMNSGATAPEWFTPTSAAVAGTKSFQVYQNTDLAIAANTQTEVVYNTEIHDDDSLYATGSGRYTPAVVGTYFVTASVCVNDIGGGADDCYIKFRVNGSSSPEYGHIRDAGGGQKNSFHTSAVIKLTSTSDYISVWCYQDAGNNRVFQGDHNNFNGYRLV